MGDVGGDRLLVHDLVGRAEEVAEARQLLTGPVRLLTLTGPPGVGKTRLAEELITLLDPTFADGTAFVDLSPARDRLGALGQIARAVGVAGAVGQRAGRHVRDALLDRQMLLVLDNAEQVEGLAGELTAMLETCPGVRLLVTSRERMHLGVEHELPVGPLEVPTSTVLDDLDDLRLVASVALFAAAARAARPQFDVTARSAAGVAEVCTRLEGLPLALILAAARVKIFTPAEIAARLAGSTAVLETSDEDVPRRHRSLESAISWSHALLAPPERLLFRRLAVFGGHWSLHAAERVCGRDGDDDVSATLLSLVDKSLVGRTDGDGAEAAFTMLAGVRAYAADQLDRSGERAAVTRRLVTYCTAVAEKVETSLGTAEEDLRWRWSARHEEDVRVCLRACLSAGRTDDALVLATSLGWAWYTRGHLDEVAATLGDVLRAAGTAGSPPAPERLAAARTVAAVAAWSRGELDRAEELLDSALVDRDRAGDDRRAAVACAFLGHVARDRGRLDRAERWHREAARRFGATGSVRGVAWARFDLGRLAWRRGELQEAAELLRDALDGFHDAGYRWAVAWCSWALGNVVVDLGRLDDGTLLLIQGLTEFEAAPDLRGAAVCCESLASVASVRDRHVEAVRLVGLSTALRRRVGAPREPADTARVSRVEAAARRRLGDFRAGQERQNGRAMTLPAARRTAGTLVERPTGKQVVEAPGQELTRREWQVARLVAEGWTNQQIGRRLGIGARTAETHVHHIMGKLDARSRAEVAAWVAVRGTARA